MFSTSLTQNLKRHHCRQPSQSLQGVQECVLFRLLTIAFYLGVFAYIPGVAGAYFAGFYDVIVVDTALYLWIVFLYLHKPLSYRFRAIGVLVSVGFLGVYLLWRLGFQGAGAVWLLIVPVLVGLLVGYKAGLAVLVATAIVLIAIGFTPIEYWSHAIGDDLSHMSKSWFVIAGNTIFLMGLMFMVTSMMIGILSKTIKELKRNISELEKTKTATIEAMATIAEFRDQGTGDHIRRTRKYVRLIAEALRKRGYFKDTLSDEYIRLLSRSAPLHDIGKIGIPDAILLKRGSLTKEEEAQMQKHTIYGYQTLKKAAKELGAQNFLCLAAEIAYTHQERWDGSGYPRALKGDEIPLSGRIMAVADVYDALRSERPYKDAMSHEETLAFLRSESGKGFDPRIIEVLDEISDELKKISEEHRVQEG